MGIPNWVLYTAIIVWGLGIIWGFLGIIEISLRIYMYYLKNKLKKEGEKNGKTSIPKSKTESASHGQHSI